jgi:hypothetical protein
MIEKILEMLEAERVRYNEVAFASNLVGNYEVYIEYNAKTDMCENAIREHFGDRVFEAWKLHVCDNLTYKEINKLGYEDLNLHNEFREIKRYMTGKFLKNNMQFTNLAKENNLF